MKTNNSTHCNMRVQQVMFRSESSGNPHKCCMCTELSEVAASLNAVAVLQLESILGMVAAYAVIKSLPIA